MSISDHERFTETEALLPKFRQTLVPARSDRIHVLLVDNDDEYREAAAEQLECLGFEIALCTCVEEMLARLDRENWRGDVIVVEWMPQAGQTGGLVAELRSRGVSVPVVFLSGVASISAEITALDRGAVDFVHKSRGISILAKRLENIVRTSNRRAIQEGGVPAEAVECENLLLRPDVGRAYWNGVDINLTLTEFRIVYLLASRMNEFLTYRAVYDCVRHAGFMAGDGDDGFRTNVRSAIRRIRNKFRKLDDGFRQIENYPSFGYRWRVGESNDAKDFPTNADLEAVTTA